MKKFLTIIFLLLFSTSVFGAKLYVGGEKYEKDGVIALILTLNGKMIEWVYKENISQCLKSKRQLALNPTKFHIEYLFIHIRLQHCVFGSIWFSKGKKQFIGCQVKPHVLRTLTTVVCSCLGLYNASIVKH